MELRSRSPRGEVVLRDRADGSQDLRVNGVFVMDSAGAGSEQALASVALAAVSAPSRVLVAGLGLGATLRAVLGDRRVQQVCLVELEPALVDWVRADRVPGGAALLADPRVDVLVGDVTAALDEPVDAYDVVLLDVDNGPDHLVHDVNAGLYETAFLGRCAAALRRGGVLAVWSMSESAALTEAMRGVLAAVRAVACPVRLGERDETYWLYLGTAPATVTDADDH